MGRPRRQQPEGKVYVARESFTTDYDGLPLTVKKGELIREGHPLLEGRAHLFQEMRVDYEWEQATAAPGEYRERGVPVAS